MEKVYDLTSGLGGRPCGKVKIDWGKEIQAVRPWYGDTKVVLRNGKTYLLCGKYNLDGRRC